MASPITRTNQKEDIEAIKESLPLMVLHVREKQTELIQIDQDGSEHNHILNIGSKATGEKHFRQEIPTEAEIECAITEVEDALMPLAKTIEKGYYQLVSSDPLVKEIAGYANQKEGELSIQEMEAVFSRYAAIISGRPPSTDVLPATKEFAAGLLILREVMHHLGFKNIRIESN